MSTGLKGPDSGRFDIRQLKRGKDRYHRIGSVLKKDEAQGIIDDMRVLFDGLSIVGTESDSLLEDEQSGDYLQDDNEAAFEGIKNLIDATEALVKKVFEKNPNTFEIRKDIENLRGEGGKDKEFAFAVLPKAHEKSSYVGLEEDEYVRREIFTKIKNLLEKIERFISED